MYKRGDIYLVQENQVQGSEIKKTRPWVIVSNNALNKARSTVLAIPLSTQAKEIPFFSIKCLVNNVTCCAILDQLRALDKQRFIRQEGTLTAYELNQIEEGLRKVLSL